MLSGNVNVGSTDRTLEDRPEAFDGVHVGIALRVLLRAVVNRAMVIADLAEDAIRGPFVGADMGTVWLIFVSLGICVFVIYSW